MRRRLVHCIGVYHADDDCDDSHQRVDREEDGDAEKEEPCRLDYGSENFLHVSPPLGFRYLVVDMM